MNEDPYRADGLGPARGIACAFLWSIPMWMLIWWGFSWFWHWWFG